MQQLSEGEKPLETACLTLNKFTKLIHKWIIDVYLQDLNRGANGIPSKLWKKYISEHPVTWPNDISELAIALGKVTYRKISNRGIQLNNLAYNCSKLHELYLQFSKSNNGLSENFKVKYNPLDISQVFVYDHIISEIWIKVPSTYLEYTKNLSEWEHFECSKRSRAEVGTVDIISLARSKVEIYKEIDEGINYSRSKVAKAKGIDSSKEIFKDNNLSNYSNSKPHTNNVKTDNNNYSVSDIGSEYEHSNQSNSVIIHLQSTKTNKSKT